MKQGLLVFALICTGFLYSQTGYFGSKNVFSLSYIGAPSFARIYDLDTYTNDWDYTLKSGYKIQSPSYRLNYDRILTDKISIGLGYTFSNVRLRTKHFHYNNIVGTSTSRKIDNIRLFNHSMSFNIKFARSGSISPVGRYWGAELVLGNANYRNNKLIDEFTIGAIQSMFLNVFIGRTFTISNSLFFSLEGRFNLLGFAYSGYETIFSLLSLDRNYGDIYHYGEYPNTGELILYSNNQNKQAINANNMSNAIFEYNYLALKFGVHYAF